MNGWIAVDLDGTLAHYTKWRADGSIGEPIPAMVNRVKLWLEQGKDVRIFTARVSVRQAEELLDQINFINNWSLKHLGRILPVTNVKDLYMIEMWDDCCVRVIPNTGERCCG